MTYILLLWYDGTNLLIYDILEHITNNEYVTKYISMTNMEIL